MATEINKNLCRLCSTKEGIKMNIFEPGKKFIFKIKFVLSIVIAEHDPLPKLLCHKCVLKIDEYYKFRMICMFTDWFLWNKLEWPDDSSQQGTLLQENEPTNTKSSSSFKEASSHGIILNADYVNSQVVKTVATPLVTDSSLLSQNNPVGNTVYLNNVSSTDNFLLEVNDDKGRTEIGGETHKSAQAKEFVGTPKTKINENNKPTPPNTMSKLNPQQKKDFSALRAFRRSASLNLMKEKCENTAHLTSKLLRTSSKESLLRDSKNKGSSQQVKKKQDVQGKLKNLKKKLVSARTSSKESLLRDSMNKGSSQQVKKKQDVQGNVKNPKKKAVSSSFTAASSYKVVKSASYQKSLNPALPLSYVYTDESNTKLDLVSNAGTQPMDKRKESCGIKVGTESWTFKGSQRFRTQITGTKIKHNPERTPPSSTSNTQNKTLVVGKKKNTQNNSLNKIMHTNNLALQQKKNFTNPLEREKDASISQEVGSETQEDKFMVVCIPGWGFIYLCNTCEQIYVSLDSANSHHCVVDNSSLSGKKVESRNGSSQKTFESETRKYLCEYCSQVFNRHVSLTSHQAAHLQDLHDPSLESDDGDDGDDGDDADYVAN